MSLSTPTTEFHVSHDLRQFVRVNRASIGHVGLINTDHPDVAVVVVAAPDRSNVRYLATPKDRCLNDYVAALRRHLSYKTER